MTRSTNRPTGTLSADSIEAELDRIRALSLDELRPCWRGMTERNAPKILSRDLLARMIAYRIQEKAFGGISREVRKLLDRLAKGDAEPVRHLKIGTVMVREHQGTLHQVIVVPGGFSWQEKTYPSLSTIARAITGTSWNGPRFFGLRGTNSADVSVQPSAPPEPKPPVSRRASVRAGRGSLQSVEAGS
jgi:hypothetical protein